MPWLFHSNNGSNVYLFQGFSRKTAKSYQVIDDFILLKCKLCTIGYTLQCTATTWSSHWTAKLNSILTLLENFYYSRIPITFFGLHHHCTHSVPNDTVLNKPCKSIGLSDTFSVCAKISDIHFNDIAFFIHFLFLYLNLLASSILYLFS